MLSELGCTLSHACLAWSNRGAFGSRPGSEQRAGDGEAGEGVGERAFHSCGVTPVRVTAT